MCHMKAVNCHDRYSPDISIVIIVISIISSTGNSYIIVVSVTATCWPYASLLQ